MKSLLILLSTFLSLALVGCKEGTIVYDIEFPRADSDEAQPPPPTVRLSAASSSLAENAGTVSISAALNKVSKSATTVALSVSGTATEGIGQDFTIDSKTLVIPAGSLSSDTTLRGLDDSFVDSEETVTLSITGASSEDRVSEDGDQQVTLTIMDDDSATVLISDNTTVEDNGSVIVTLSLDNEVQNGFWVTVERTDGSATEAEDKYTAETDKVTFTGIPGETHNVSVSIGSDTKVEDNETLTLRLGSVSRSGIVITDTGTVTITNDDSAAVTIADVNVAENVAGRTATLTLTLDNAVQGGFAVDASTSDGTATVAGSDYTAISGQTLSFVGNAGETETVTVTLNNDAIAEGDEALTLGMSNLASTSLSVGISDTGMLTINDDATTLTIADVSVAENSGPAVITLTSDKAVAGGLTVDVSTSDGSATTGDSDYTALSSQTVTFTGNAGESQTVNITLGADSKLENDETLMVSMSNSSKPSLMTITDTATVTITNDDSATVSIADQTTAEDSGPSVVTLSVDNPVQGGFWVTVLRADGSDDYYRVYWTTVAPGARTPANRDIDQTDNATRTIDADRIIFVHGGLNSATYYYYRLAVYDTSTGAWKFSTNELGASLLPVECTSTGGTLEITDNDPDLLVYYPLNNDLQDYSPQGTRTGAEGWPYHLAEGSSDSNIDFGEGCAYGNSGYMSGSGAYDGTRGNGTWGVNNNFSNADFPANDGNWTVSVWTSPDGDLEKFTSIFSTGDNNKGPELQLDVDDKFEPIGKIRLFNKMSDNLKGQQLRQSTWYHVVAVHHADDSVELYVNNVLKDTETNWPYVDGTDLQWDKIKIGQNRYRDANYKRYIDEFKIYGRAFTASEVANLYNFTLPPAVESINVSGQGGSTLRLTWDEVDGAIDYTIFQAEKSSSGLTNVITFTNPNLNTSADPDLSAIPGITSCTSGSCSYDVTGLTNNKYYYYRIAARNGRGSGQVSPNSEVSAQCCSP